jgi:peptidoglycan hydrolase CwlO-like protein
LSLNYLLHVLEVFQPTLIITDFKENRSATFMSDFIKKFKSIFIVEEPTSPPTDKQTVTAAVNNTSTATTQGTVNNRFLEILANALEQNNQPGFDYFEFRQSLAGLGQMAMDESTRFKSAFAVAQTMGVNPTNLLESAQYYIQVLQGEQSKFNEAHAQQRAKLIGNREQEAGQLDVAIQEKARQIEALTQQMDEHKQRIEQLKAEINESTLKIESTKADFEATFTSVVEQLQSDVTKIKQYL